MSYRPTPRVVIQGVQPEIDCGRFPIKRTIGETVDVEADVFADGYDVVACVLRYRHEDDETWSEIAMEPLGNDHWRAQFAVGKLGQYIYTIAGWPDPFQTWYQDFLKRISAGQDVTVDLVSGARLLQAAAQRAAGTDAAKLKHLASDLKPADVDDRLSALASSYADRTDATFHKELRVTVDPVRARFSTWYEMFPRSCGTFKHCRRVLPEIAELGFDVLYFPPIHPIGHSHRKGKNNAREAGPGDPGSPWAIGSEEGGHKAIHAELGTLEDFRNLVAEAKRKGIEIALDLAYQCSPDHPYVNEHPEWFRWRPDGTVQYAENPPKKYEDIYPFEFETPHWRSLWEELKSIVEFWIDQGVRIFRVDNPHTKPFDFWEWMIRDLKKKHPDLIFLSEAFTRPNIMYHLAKLGFNQSYTYFTWRNTKHELTEYFTELTRTEVAEFFRPNLWPNTPDILHEYLQRGGRPAFMARLVLAATLGANYGIYGPAFELCENRALRQGSEEYLDSEKYQIRAWDTGSPDSLKGLVARVNEIRRENPALQSDWSLRFHTVDNDQLIVYSKATEDLSDIILVIVNLDPHYKQSGWVEVPLQDFQLAANQSYQVHDLLTGARYLWQGARNYVELNPSALPAHIFKVRRRVRTERDFDYFL